MRMENPFLNVNSPSLRPPSLNEGGGFPVASEPSLVKGGQGEFTLSNTPSSPCDVGTCDDSRIYTTRRADLRPAVRDYADKLHARLLDIYKKYGAIDAKGMYANVSARKDLKNFKAVAEEAAKLQYELEQVLDSGEFSIYHELPPLQEFQKLIAKIEARGASVSYLGDWEEYEMIGGQLNGRVGFLDGRSLPVIGGEVIESVCGLDIESCYDVRNVDGKLNGSVELSDDHTLPVIDGKLVRAMGNLMIQNCHNVHNVDGKLNGRVKLQKGWTTVIGGEPIEEVGGVRIQKSFDVRNVDGKLNGSVELPDRRRLPVIGGELIGEVGGEEILGCADVHNIDGKLNGRVVVSGVGWLPVLGGELIKEVGGFEIFDCADVRNVDGKLNGCFTLSDRRVLPVIGGEMILEIDGHGIQLCEVVRNIGGKLNCRVVLQNGRWLPVISGDLIEEVDGTGIRSCANVYNIGGKLNGIVEILSKAGNKVRKYVLLGKLID